MSRALSGKVTRGFAWSAVSNASMRLGSLLTGVVLARLLVPEEFGVYAIALMVQVILINLAELGLAADLVRHGDLDRRGPTITTVALGASGTLMVLMWVTAEPVARLMGSAEAAPVIVVMALTLPLAGITAVPFAHLQREFQQSKLFMIEASNFVVGTVVTISLVVADWGPISLAIGRVAGQVVATVLQFHLTGRRFRVGWQPDIARSGIRFGLPLACAGVLAWTLLNIDTMLVGGVAGATALGFYVLAFNISSWPSSVIGTAVRAVAFPAFSQRSLESGQRDVTGVVRATSVVWAAALPVAVVLAILADPVIEVVYGQRWLPSAPVLVGLAVFGALRVAFDLWIAYLTACGAAGALLWTQVVWIAALTPAMYLAIQRDGIVGAGWAHVIVAALVMLPVYLATMRRYDVPVGALLLGFLPASLGVLPAAAAGLLVAGLVDNPYLRILAAGSALALTYLACMWPWLRTQRRLLKDPPAPVDPAPVQTNQEVT
ncbi:lipopolysaccharide biosynthesis protein [Nocardioides sp. LHG3406-4]|uniref:lipopolysaccharide biosynthesis protein n=1 Tax=Nocardioides sp. LHG3406-4 TaxID=2804575 RepID=UPI003CF0D318